MLQFCYNFSAKMYQNGVYLYRLDLFVTSFLLKYASHILPVTCISSTFYFFCVPRGTRTLDPLIKSQFRCLSIRKLEEDIPKCYKIVTIIVSYSKIYSLYLTLAHACAGSYSQNCGWVMIILLFCSCPLSIAVRIAHTSSSDRASPLLYLPDRNGLILVQKFSHPSFTP